MGYNFVRGVDGSIIMDRELTKEDLGVEPQDQFTVVIRDNQIILQKQTHGHSGTDQ